MSQPTQCPTCGANLSLHDMTRPNCPYCNNVLPHHARAAEHAALVNQVLDQRIGQYGGPYAPQNAHVPYQYGAPPPNMQPYAQQAYDQAAKSVGRAMIWVAVSVGVTMVLVIGMAILLMFL